MQLHALQFIVVLRINAALRIAFIVVLQISAALRIVFMSYCKWTENKSTAKDKRKLGKVYNIILLITNNSLSQLSNRIFKYNRHTEEYCNR